MLADGSIEPLAPQAHENEAMAEAVREQTIETLLCTWFLTMEYLLSGRSMVFAGHERCSCGVRTKDLRGWKHAAFDLPTECLEWNFY